MLVHQTNICPATQLQRSLDDLDLRHSPVCGFYLKRIAFLQLNNQTRQPISAGSVIRELGDLHAVLKHGFQDKATIL
ncbi:hypothetical protein [Pacificibacter sp. AS14]|uniref:hypothetical protein n=1 Tax=Alphaproteobacteria TaxID=28211 RepID=UPI00316B0BEE